MDNSTPKDFKGTLLMIEGILIILLTLFSGYLANQNKKLVEELQRLTVPTAMPTPTASPTPSGSATPSASPSATPKATKIPTLSPTPTP